MTKTSYQLSQESLQEIEQARKRKGWNRTDMEWCEQAEVSESTLKRFLRRKRISADNFINICDAVGIKDWQRLAGLEEYDTNENNPTETQAMQPQYALTVNGVFAKEQKLQVETILEVLKNLLLNPQIVIKSQNGIDKSTEIDG